MEDNVKLMPHFTKEVTANITGYKVCSYLVALEGWRRGLRLTWHVGDKSTSKEPKRKYGNEGKYFSLSSNKKTHYFFGPRGDKVTIDSVRLVKDKKETKRLLSEKGVPVPKGKVFHINDNQVFDYAEDIGFPVVIKPVDGRMGRGVYTNINSLNELRNARNDMLKRYDYKEVILEKHYNGEEYRVYVVGDEAVGITHRVPANIQGDGVHSIRDLIHLKNEKRKGNPYLRPKPIKIDYEVKLALKNKGLTLDSIMPEGEYLKLREISNLSAGGDPLEAEDELSDEVKRIAVEALKALPSFPHGGLDIIVDPESEDKGVVLEVNGSAEITFHVYPWEGKAIDIPGAIIDYYFPETIGQEKSAAYFDYHSLIEPLKTGAALEVTNAPAPKNEVIAKKLCVKGKVHKVGYMKYIKRHAVRIGLNGYAKKQDKGIEIFVCGEDKQKLENFIKYCSKGSPKSKVDSVEEEDIDMNNKPFKMGFEVFLQE